MQEHQSVYFPNEILTYILQYACDSPNSLTRLRLVSKQFHTATSEPVIWRSLSSWQFFSRRSLSLLHFSSNHQNQTPQIGLVFEKNFGALRNQFRDSHDDHVTNSNATPLQSAHSIEDLNRIVQRKEAQIEFANSNSPFTGMGQLIHVAHGLRNLHALASARKSFNLFLVALFVWLCLIYPMIIITMHHANNIPPSFSSVMHLSESATAVITCICCGVMLWFDVRQDRSLDQTIEVPQWMIVAIMIIVPLAVMVLYMFLAVLSMPMMMILDFFFQAPLQEITHGSVRTICSYYVRLCEALLFVEVIVVAGVIVCALVHSVLKKRKFKLS